MGKEVIDQTSSISDFRAEDNCRRRRNELGEQRVALGGGRPTALTCREGECEVQNQWVRELFKQFARRISRRIASRANASVCR